MSNFDMFFHKPDVYYTEREGILFGNGGYRMRCQPIRQQVRQPTVWGTPPFVHGAQVTPYFPARTTAHPAYIVTPTAPREAAFVLPSQFAAPQLRAAVPPPAAAATQ